MEDDKQTTDDLTPEAALEENAKLRKRLDKVTKESLQRKEQLRKLEAEQAAKDEEAQAQREAERAATEKALKEQGKYQPLYESAQKRITELEGELEVARVQNKSYTKVLSSSVEKRREGLPEEYRAMVPDGDPTKQLEWLDKFTPLLTRPVPERRNANTTPPHSNGNQPLTPEQATVMKAAGMTEEEYREGLSKINIEPVA